MTNNDVGKACWVSICKEFYNPIEGVTGKNEGVVEERRRVILEVLEWFDTFSPREASDAEGVIAVISGPATTLCSQCNLSVAQLIDNEGELWYEYNELRSAARAEVHAESTKKRIDKVVDLAESLSVQYDVLGMDDVNRCYLASTSAFKMLSSLVAGNASYALSSALNILASALVSFLWLYR